MDEERSIEADARLRRGAARIREAGLSIPRETYLLKTIKRIDWKRLLFILLGIVLFAVVYYSPAWPDAVDPLGARFALSREGKAAIALFLLALTWWGFEVVPIGITSVAVGVIQALFLIRDAKAAFTDFMDPAVWFIFASLIIGMAFTRTGLTQRFAYRIMGLMGERTSMIYLGCFSLITVLTLAMAHTAVAAAIYPLLMAIYALYEEDTAPTKFGKGLFLGMPYACAAASIVTLLGSARAPVALGFFRDMAHRDISFFELSYYMLPLGWTIVALIWFFIMVVYRPEKKTIPGLRERLKVLSARLGPMSHSEILTLSIVACAILLLALRSLIPALRPLDKSAVMLMCTLLFFFFKILTVKDLEEIPWNIVLLFGGAMSMGFCLWQTGAANWIGINWLGMFQTAHWFVFVMTVVLIVLTMTNFIINVATIAIALPVALAAASYLGVSPEVVMFSSLAAAGMPFALLIGQAPNAIAYESRQFTPGEFFRTGVVFSILVMGVLGVFVLLVWPLMGMPVLAH